MDEQLEQQFQEAFNQFLSLYIMYAGTKDTPYNVEELNFIKTPVEMPNGGKYLLTFCHVEGPKIPFKKVEIKDGNGTDAGN